MKLLQTIRKCFFPVHREGYRFVAIFLGFTLWGGWFSPHLFWIGALLTLWCAFFFRDPERVTPLDERLVMSPADGIISSIGQVSVPPELGLGAVEMTRISIFMDVFSCHINRSPVCGIITHMQYVPGKFLNASLDKASLHNERNALVIENSWGKTGVIQVAGLIARRIVSWKKEKMSVNAGERFGMIRFGSRVDVFLSSSFILQVLPGQTMVAGETILACLDSHRTPLSSVQVG